MEMLTTALLLPILSLLALGCVPSRWANSSAGTFRRFVTWIVGLELLLAMVLAVAYAVGRGEALSLSLLRGSAESPFQFGIFYDGASSLMLLLVSFVGLIVSRYSIRYLDGEASQGRYFRWLGFTIGAVSLMVIAGNLLLFFLAWVMTSWGLHHLLLHYQHRPAAKRAAWTKFAISRLGDAFLITALVLTYQAFGTFELSELFAKVGGLNEASRTPVHTAIAWCLMLGAVTKSAQFPFHTWLPDTMETPTPVSALMHAGVVNAGGFLVIRLSPLVSQATSALLTLAIIGAVTACFGAVVMMTQPSVKRSLAYSTIAQMGFMMLQCGLGAFSAAMLHILAHSLYKAHAFLNSGSVVTQAAATRPAGPSRRASGGWAYLLGAGAAVVAAYLAISLSLGSQSFAKPNGLVLAFILCLALTTWGWRLFAFGERRVAFLGLVGVSGLCLTYLGAYVGIDYLLASAMPVVSWSPPALVAFGAIAFMFFLLFALHTALLQGRQPAWLQPLRVHAANGFYIGALYRRLFEPLAKL